MDSESNKSSDLVDPFEVLMETVVKCTDEEIRREFSKYADIDSVYLKGGRSGHIRTKTEDGTGRLLSLTKKNNAFMKKKDMKFRIAYKKECVPADKDYQPIVSLYNILPVAEDDTLPTIHMLNDDVLLHIFSFLDLNELVGGLEVCKRFALLCKMKIYDFLKEESMDEVKDIIDYLTNFYLYSEDTVCKILKLVSDNVKSLGLPQVDFEIGKVQKEITGTISSHYRSLEELKVEGNWDVTEILEKNPQLKHLEMTNVSRRTAEKMVKVISALPALEYLYLKSFKAVADLLDTNPMPSLKTVEVLDRNRIQSYLYKLLKWCPNVHSFGFHIGDRISHKNVKDVIELLPHLHSLSFTPEQLDRFFLPLTETFPSIKALHLKDELGTYINDIAKQFPNLEQLVLTTYFYGLPFIEFEHFKQLKELYVYGVTSEYSTSGVDSLKKCPNLESIVYYSLSTKDVIRLIKALPNLKHFECKTLIFSKKDVLEIVEICKNRTSKLCLIVHPLNNSNTDLLQSVCDLKLEDSVGGHRNGYKFPSFINIAHIEYIYGKVSRKQRYIDDSSPSEYEYYSLSDRFDDSFDEYDW